MKNKSLEKPYKQDEYFKKWLVGWNDPNPADRKKAEGHTFGQHGGYST